MLEPGYSGSAPRSKHPDLWSGDAAECRGWAVSPGGSGGKREKHPYLWRGGCRREQWPEVVWGSKQQPRPCHPCALQLLPSVYTTDLLRFITLTLCSVRTAMFHDVTLFHGHTIRRMIWLAGRLTSGASARASSLSHNQLRLHLSAPPHSLHRAASPDSLQHLTISPGDQRPAPP